MELVGILALSQSNKGHVDGVTGSDFDPGCCVGNGPMGKRERIGGPLRRLRVIQARTMALGPKWWQGPWGKRSDFQRREVRDLGTPTPASCPSSLFSMGRKAVMGPSPRFLDG